MADQTNRKSFVERRGGLYNLLMDRLPTYRSKQNVLDIPAICRDMGCSNEALYKCLRNDQMRTGLAERLLTFSHENHPETAVYWEDLAPFVLPNFVRFSRDAEAADMDLDDLI